MRALDAILAMTADHPPPAPYFEDLQLGYVERRAPALTLSDGMASLHRAIVGDRLRLALDARLAREVVDRGEAGRDAPLAHPALVWDVAIGQSTVLTGRVIANLFYRGLVLRRAPALGDTLSTTTEVVALRRTAARAGRPPRGLAALRVRTVDQEHRPVLDFWRCAMLPLHERRGAVETDDAADAFAQIPSQLDPGALRESVAGWRLERFPAAGRAARGALSEGARWRAHAGDLVSGAPELARLTLNLAAAHHDGPSQPSGRRLVYGGHTIGIAAAQAGRALPAEIATIVGWHSCEHLAPVYEGDTLRSEVELERLEPSDGEATLAHLRSRVRALRDGETEAVEVLDWRFVAALA